MILFETEIHHVQIRLTFDDGKYGVAWGDRTLTGMDYDLAARILGDRIIQTAHTREAGYLKHTNT